MYFIWTAAHLHLPKLKYFQRLPVNLYLHKLPTTNTNHCSSTSATTSTNMRYIPIIVVAFIAETAFGVSCDTRPQANQELFEQMIGHQFAVPSPHKVSGRGLSQFDQFGAMKLEMRRISSGLGSTHVSSESVGTAMKEILQKCCCEKGISNCVGNTDILGDQGDRVNVNIASD